MHHEYASSSGPSDIPGLSLRTIWQVSADETYDVSKRQSTEDSQVIHKGGGTGNVAIYTVDGAGRLYLDGGTVIDLANGTLITSSFREILRYHTRRSIWKFWWFEFTTSGPWPTKSNQILQVGNDADDLAMVQTVYRELRSERIERRRLASANFSALMHRWLADWHGEHKMTSLDRAISHSIDLIHQDIYKPWRVSELARSAGLSERLFTDAFAKATGMPPKQFLTRLRLEMASELLRLGIYNVSEAADRFGFSSAYHFSNAFYKHFGHRPSKTKP